MNPATFASGISPLCTTEPEERHAYLLDHCLHDRLCGITEAGGHPRVPSSREPQAARTCNPASVGVRNSAMASEDGTYAKVHRGISGGSGLRCPALRRGISGGGATWGATTGDHHRAEHSRGSPSACAAEGCPYPEAPTFESRLGPSRARCATVLAVRKHPMEAGGRDIPKFKELSGNIGGCVIVILRYILVSRSHTSICPDLVPRYIEQRSTYFLDPSYEICQDSSGLRA
jgi:hypothetical protein